MATVLVSRNREVGRTGAYGTTNEPGPRLLHGFVSETHYASPYNVTPSLQSSEAPSIASRPRHPVSKIKRVDAPCPGGSIRSNGRVPGVRVFLRRRRLGPVRLRANDLLPPVVGSLLELVTSSLAMDVGLVVLVVAFLVPTSGFAVSISIIITIHP